MRLIYTATRQHVPSDFYIAAADISFVAADKSINSTVSNLSANNAVGRWIKILGSNSNNGWVQVASIVSANKITVNEVLVNESAGAGLVLDGFLHGNGQQYTLESKATTLSKNRVRESNTEEAIEKSYSQTLLHWSGYEWEVETDRFYHASLALWEEFEASVEARELFTFDPYGYVATPGTTYSVEAIKAPQIKRIAHRMEYACSLTVRVVA